MTGFRELSAEAKALGRKATKVPVKLPQDKGRQFKYRVALEGGLSFKSLLAEVKKLEKIIAASKYSEGA